MIDLRHFLVIDTDTSWIKKFQHRLKVLGIEEQFAVEEIFPDTSLPDRELIERCILEIARRIGEVNVVAVFIDIVIKEEGDLDILGIMIAREVRARWPMLPVFNVTGKLRGDQEQELFSEATLEDVDGVLAKVFLYGSGASAGRLRQMLEGRRRRRSVALSTIVVAEPNTAKALTAKEAFGEKDLEPRMRVLIEDLGSAEFWGLLGELLPQAEGTLSIINPGRSGAVVIKALARFSVGGRSATFPTAWIIKVGRDVNLLQRELDGYKELGKTPLGRGMYPRLLHGDVKVVGGLGGVAIEFEGDAETLLEFLAREQSPGDVKMVAGSLVEGLTMLYGQPIVTLARPWVRFYHVDDRLEARLLGVIDELRSLLGPFVDEHSIRRIIAFIMSHGRSEVRVADYQGEIRTCYLHGDLNSRNILVTKDRKAVFIDFASRVQGHVARDAAKLERDIILRVADWSRAEFYDWKSIGAWDDLLVLPGLVSPDAEWVASVNDRYKNEALFIEALRGMIAGPSYRVSEQEYSIALIYFLLLGLLHPEVSVQKKVFALRALGKLISF